jgi:thymidylate kinase
MKRRIETMAMTSGEKSTQERFENITFQSRVYEIFDELKREEKGGKWYEIDCCKKTIKEIHQEISRIVQNNIKIDIEM